jgi:hypothetical protein
MKYGSWLSKCERSTDPETPADEAFFCVRRIPAWRLKRPFADHAGAYVGSRDHASEGTFGQHARQTRRGFSSGRELADGMTEKTTAFFRPQDGHCEVTFTAATFFVGEFDWLRTGCGVGFDIVHLARGDAR